MDLHPWRYMNGQTLIEELRYEEGRERFDFPQEITQSREKDHSCKKRHVDKKSCMGREQLDMSLIESYPIGQIFSISVSSVWSRSRSFLE